MPAALESAVHGCRRMLGAKRLVVWLWLANLLFALPLAALVASSIRRSIGASRVADELLEGLDLVWHAEYRAEAEGVGSTLEPSQVGVGAFLDNLELWFSGGLFELEPGLVAAGCLYGVLWALLLGGVLAYLQNGERPTVRGFFGFGGEFFFRFVRLTAVLAGVYYLIYRLGRWLFGVIEYRTRDVTVETRVLGYYLLGALLLVTLLAAVRMTADYARAAMILEDRRSALLAAVRGARFVLGRPLRTFGVLLPFVAAGLLVLWLYHLVAPGPGQSGWIAVVAAFLGGQLVLILRLGVRVALLGAELDLYEREMR